MTLPPQRWLKAVLIATTLVFVGVAVYVFGFRFIAWLESDAAVTPLLAAKVLQAKSPVVTDWYYANGDVWVLGPQLLAILPVAIVGLGPASLLITLVLGIVIEMILVMKVYFRLSGERWIAVFAAMATLMAWSSSHVAYAYIQLAYGFVTTLYLISFHLFTVLAENASDRRRWWRFAGASLLVALIAIQNPTRGLVYVVAPVLVACAWPWRAFPVRRRLALAAAALAGWVLAFVVYTIVLSRVAAFSVPRGHLAFVFGGVAEIKANISTFGYGLALLCGGGADPGVRAVPGALLLVGAFAFVSRVAFGSRAFTALRFFSVIVIAQLGGVVVPLLLGNLLDGPLAVRYMMPSLIAMIGVAVVIAVRTLSEVGKLWWRRLAIGWLVVVPIAALVAARDARPPKPRKYVWPNAAELSDVADELVRRGLTHGFSINLSANLLTLDSGGAAWTCPIYFRDIIMPQRWLADTACFNASELPDRFYVVAYNADHDRHGLRATLPPEIEKFSIGKTYEVYVYRTADTSLAWLDLPVPDGELAKFPMRLPATHLQILRGKASVESGDLVATGEPGTVVYGPYLELPAGTYEVSWTGHGLGSGGQISFAATADAGIRVLARFPLDANAMPGARTELVRLSFTLLDARTIVELPIESQQGGRVSLHELVIEKKTSP